MLILLNTDPYIDDREAVHEHLESVVREVLGGHDAWIIRIAAYLTDANGTVSDGNGPVDAAHFAQLRHEPDISKALRWDCAPIPPAPHTFARFAEPQHAAGHRHTHAPLTQREGHGAKGEIQKRQMHNSHLQRG